MRDTSLCAAAAGGQHEPRAAQPDRGLRPRAQQGGVGHHQPHQVPPPHYLDIYTPLS